MTVFPRRFTKILPRLLACAACLAALAACGDQSVPDFMKCTISPTSLSFGTVEVGSSADKTFTVTNGGSGSLSGSVSACGDYGVVGDAGYSLAKGESKTFTLRFSPSASGPRACTVSIGGCGQLAVSGQGAAQPGQPVCSLSTSSLAFGTVTVGQSATRTFTITNTGGGTLSGTVTEGCAEFSIEGTATYSLGASQSATFTVRFAPTNAGDETCAIDPGSTCGAVSATGSGQAPPPDPVCSLSTSALAFGTVTVGQSATRTFTITNTGGGTLSGTVTESCLEFSIEGTATYSLGASQSATITVRFAPLTTGDKTCTINTGSTCANLTATGTGQALAPSCQLSATSLAFGDVVTGQTADRTLTVTNPGLVALTGTLTESCAEFSIVGDATYDLAALQSKTFTLRFATTTTGDFACTLDAGSACGTVSLTGRGVPPPQCSLAETSFDFGQVRVGRHSDHNFAISNVGGGQLCGTASESCAGFSLVAPSYCAVPGTPYNLKVRFAPEVTGPFQCTIDVGAGCPAITVTGVGVP